jgi:outer membrane protein assembly factor BamB
LLVACSDAVPSSSATPSGGGAPGVGAQTGAAGDTGAAPSASGGSAPQPPGDPAAPGGPLTGPLTDGPMTLYRLRFEKALLDELRPTHDLEVLIQRVGDQLTSIAMLANDVGLGPWALKPPTLVASGDKVEGSQMFWYGNEAMAMKLDLTVSGTSVAGTYEFVRSQAVDFRPDVIVRMPADYGGAVTGTAETEADLAQRNAVTPEAGWDSWLGPNQNFSALPTAVELVDAPAAGKVVWRSEFMADTEHGSCRWGAQLKAAPGGFGASPLLYDGRVFAMHHVPTPASQKLINCYAAELSSPELQQVAGRLGLTQEELKAPWFIGADEIVLALDAATGRTLWRTVFVGEGINFFDHKVAITNHTGTAGDGRVYVLGALGIVRALEAATGKVLWATPLSGLAGAMQEVKQKALETGDIPNMTRSFAHGLNFIDGVVVAPNGTGQSGLVGLNAETGAELWASEPNILGAKQTPLRWSAGGKDYVVATNAAGEITCIDPSDGQVLWQVVAAGEEEYQSVIGGNLLVTRGGVFELSATGAEKKWDLPCRPNARATALIDGDVVFTRCNAREDGKCEAPGDCYVLGLELATGKQLVRDDEVQADDEAHAFAMAGRVFFEPDSQHGSINWQMFPTSPAGWQQLGASGIPSFWSATTYAVPLSHAASEGRIFVRGNDGIYCLDMRR